MHPNGYDADRTRRSGAPDFDECHGWQVDHARTRIEGRIWIGLALGAAFTALGTIALGDALARADRPSACAGLTSAAECSARMAEAL